MIIRIITILLVSAGFALAAENPVDFRVLATNRTSTMEKELNEASEAGFRMDKVMGGNTEFGGSEVVVVMSKKKTSPAVKKYSYKLLATNKTSTMEKELQTAGDLGFSFVGVTVGKTAYGGKEVLSILKKEVTW
jgi:hypothetical protein